MDTYRKNQTKKFRKSVLRFQVGLFMSLITIYFFLNIPLEGKNILTIEEELYADTLLSIQILNPNKKQILHKKATNKQPKTTTKIETTVEKEKVTVDSTSEEIVPTETITQQQTDTFAPLIATAFPDIMPEYPGGEPAFMVFLAKELRLDYLQRYGVESGYVIIEFIIDENGEMQNPHAITNELGFDSDRVIINSLYKMEKWKPGEFGGKKYPVVVRLPIFYQN